MIPGFAISTSLRNSLRLNLTLYELEFCVAAEVAAVEPAIANYISPPNDSIHIYSMLLSFLYPR